MISGLLTTYFGKINYEVLGFLFPNLFTCPGFVKGKESFFCSSYCKMSNNLLLEKPGEELMRIENVKENILLISRISGTKICEYPWRMKSLKTSMQSLPTITLFFLDVNSTTDSTLIATLLMDMRTFWPYQSHSTNLAARSRLYLLCWAFTKAKSQQ